MREDLKYPDIEAVKSILVKIGVDPMSRDLNCQDFEYTTCELQELDAYIKLYEERETSIYEKRVLGCYFLECLNEHVSIHNEAHPSQQIAFGLLHSDKDIHKSELAYWKNTKGRTEDEWWPITKYLNEWKNT